MPLSVDDVTYFTLNEVAEEVGRRRETVWRWIKAGDVPEGRRYRNRERLFTQEELDVIDGFANRIEPITVGDPDQLNVFEQQGGTT